MKFINWVMVEITDLTGLKDEAWVGVFLALWVVFLASMGILINEVLNIAMALRGAP